jgi:hypothetical protein
MGKSLLLTLKAALRSTAVHDAVVNDRAGEGDRDQAKLMVTPGTMWHTVRPHIPSNPDFREPLPTPIRIAVRPVGSVAPVASRHPC